MYSVINNSMELETYNNGDGTYTSPRNGRTYKSLKAFRAHWHHAGTGGWTEVNSTKQACSFCEAKYSLGNIQKHEDACYLNPTNLTLCLECEEPIKNYKYSKGTCSRSCANTYFKQGSNNGNWQGNNYQAICFEAHGKKCLVCGEEKVVAAHHVNHDHSDNRPENLVPLCPTHHTYVHSKYRDEVQPIIDDYISQ